MHRVLLLAGALSLAGCEVLPPSDEMPAQTPQAPPWTASDAAATAADAAPLASLDASAVPDASTDAAAPQQTDAGSDAQAGAFAPGCSFLWWPSPDAPSAYHFCALAPANGCNCNGVAVSAPPTDTLNCLQTLATACGVDTNARTGCEHGYGGSCWPSATAGDAWLCECLATGLRSEVRSSSCRAAGESLCKPAATACEDQTGRCKPDAQGIFVCECPFDFPAVHNVRGDRCVDALRKACVGGLSVATAGADCMTESFTLNTPPAGICLGQGRSPQDGYACTCDLGDGSPRQRKVVAPSCDAALRFSCPEAAAK
jgi:hypothetical protein